ncbi:hypothetical protein [Anditalea andensis]|uniref:Uncharacterized protein n=1 Tax=Anditalea andensis TaxID=1048983 RepID=A0A074KUF9_9BACT|nr:hypothetical protein [Anditalea andensis]KEO71915.1 hypothetical protein EL17_20580 [Anditalea andensis]
MNPIVQLKKEDIASIRFSHTDVLANPVSVLLREKDMERALILGNLEHTKVRITFMDLYQSTYEVETTVWAITEESICLKGHLYLPKKAVLSLC